jgi:Sec7-like guanine-nucleotide exchange factor
MVKKMKQLTVADLIDYLKALNPEMPIVYNVAGDQEWYEPVCSDYGFVFLNVEKRKQETIRGHINFNNKDQDGIECLVID